MNIRKLFEMQTELDAHILENHPVQPGESRLQKKLLALSVELGECANEFRKWKFWSSDQNPRFGALLEELVDVLHFILSVGIELKIHPAVVEYATPMIYDDATTQFRKLFAQIDVLPSKTLHTDYKKVWRKYLGLVKHLGFTEEQVELAYMLKNRKNHTRQNEGY